MDDAAREAGLKNLAYFKAQGEKAYDDMYEAHSFGSARVCYSDAKDYLAQAITLANELGLTDEAAALDKRLQHIKAVFQHQFVQ
ncbi:MAG: hypothetical protein KGJ78_09595 [Alphaproteobacteria bacterium]|nr:hypothetical protein [Alphaproteobacteria bacterium]